MTPASEERPDFRHSTKKIPFYYGNVILEARSGIRVPSAWSCLSSQRGTRKHHVTRALRPYAHMRAQQDSAEVRRAALKRESPAALGGCVSQKAAAPHEGCSEEMLAVAVGGWS